MPRKSQVLFIYVQRFYLYVVIDHIVFISIISSNFCWTALNLIQDCIKQICLLPLRYYFIPPHLCHCCYLLCSNDIKIFENADADTSDNPVPIPYLLVLISFTLGFQHLWTTPLLQCSCQWLHYHCFQLTPTNISFIQKMMFLDLYVLRLIPCATRVLQPCRLYRFTQYVFVKVMSFRGLVPA